MRATFRAGLAALVLALVPAVVTAQEEANTAPWKDSFYPFFPSLGNNFPLIALHLEERKAADYFARNPYAGLFSLDVGQGFTGARMAVARFHAPLLAKDWRFNVLGGTTRETRLGYFGLGNDTKDDESLVTKRQPHWYEARRTRYFGSAEVTLGGTSEEGVVVKEVRAADGRVLWRREPAPAQHPGT